MFRLVCSVSRYGQARLQQNRNNRFLVIGKCLLCLLLFSGIRSYAADAPTDPGKKVTMPNLNAKLAAFSDPELFSLYVDILLELRNREIIRTNNSPTGDYAEWLVARAFDMTLQPNSNTGFDAIDSDKKKVQIKARRITPNKPSLQLSALRKLDENEFDYLVAVVFDERYALLRAFKIPHKIIGDHAPFSEHQNGHILTLNKKICTARGVVDITDQLASSGLCAVSKEKFVLK